MGKLQLLREYQTTTIRKSRSPQQSRDSENLLLSITYQLFSSGPKEKYFPPSLVLYESAYAFLGNKRSNDMKKSEFQAISLYSQTKTGHIRMRFYFSIRFNDTAKAEREKRQFPIRSSNGRMTFIDRLCTKADFLAHLISKRDVIMTRGKTWEKLLQLFLIYSRDMSFSRVLSKHVYI